PNRSCRRGGCGSTPATCGDRKSGLVPGPLWRILDAADQEHGLAAATAFEPATDEVTRMRAQAAKIGSGFVLLPEEAPCLGPHPHELTAFPNGKHGRLDPRRPFVPEVTPQMPD